MDLIELLGDTTPIATLDRILPGPYCELVLDGVPLALQLAKDDDGRLVCTGLLLGWSEPRTVIHTQRLRLRLGALLSSLADQTGLELAADLPEMPRRPRGRPKLPDAHYERVGALYAAAVEACPDSPVTTVARQENVDRLTVHRWLREGRRRGLIPPSAGGEG